MTNKMYLIAVLLLISTYSLFGQKPMEEDPNVMWTYQNSFHSFPSVHPNGNVLIRSHYDVLEINGLTGELIRRIYVPVAGVNTDRISISQDGTRFMVRGCLVDYESGEVLKQGIPTINLFSFLHPYNDKIIYEKDSYALIVLDLNDYSETQYVVSDNDKFSTTALSVSNDGRFLALARRDFEDEYNTYFDLFDAKTLKPIRQLEKVKAEGGTIEFIQFSENAKYVGYGHLGGSLKATLFNCNPPYTKKEFDVKGLGFIKDEYVFLSSYYEEKSLGVTWNINEEKEIYRTELYSSLLPLYNKTHNNLVLDYFYVEEVNQVVRQLTSLNLNKILTGVRVEKPKEPFSYFTTEYIKGTLTISNFVNITGIVKIEIIDIQGNIMLSTVYSSITDYGRIEIVLNLPLGVYIVQLQDGKQNYSQKFLVVE